jgi:GNAT superfamily N-acetyltransferase
MEWPRVPGHEVVGRIEAIGGHVEGWTVGQRVGVGFLAGSCGHCGYCRAGDFVNGQNQGYTGTYTDGGYAEVMIAKASGLIAIPNKFNSVDAAPLLCAGITTFSALRNAPAKAGDLVAILGIGGLGHLAVQYARHMGFEVAAIGRGSDRIELAKKLGAHHYIDNSTVGRWEGSAKAWWRNFGRGHCTCLSSPRYALCSMSDTVELIQVEYGPRLDDIRELFLEYARSLDFDLCFQNFDEELRELPGEYAPPEGRLILCRVQEAAAGCIALKSLGDGICEMKRLFVRPQFRGKGLAITLGRRIVEEARQFGYKAMRLDTIAGKMEPAIALYRSLGFQEIPPYYDNPIPNAVYFELDLRRGQALPG